MKALLRIFILLVVILVLILVFQPQKEDISEEASTMDVNETEESDEYALLRARMVKEQLQSRDITDITVLAVMQKVPRHRFMPSYLNLAYEDRPVPIGYGQTISQPYIVALMTQVLELNNSDRVLEIGTGSGYQAAVLAEIVDDVYTIEIIRELAERANSTLKKLGYKNVEVKHADGYFGWQEHAPFDAIIITAAANHVPPSLVEQLKDNGKLIMPLSSPAGFQTLTLIIKKDKVLDTKFITGVRFVPMTGEAQK